MTMRKVLIAFKNWSDVCTSIFVGCVTLHHYVTLVIFFYRQGRENLWIVII